MFGPKLINDRDAGDTTEDAWDYSSIPKWHGILTVAGLVLTVYLDFLPPMHVRCFARLAGRLQNH